MNRSVSEIWNFLTITVGFRGLTNCCLDILLYSKKGEPKNGTQSAFLLLQSQR